MNFDVLNVPNKKLTSVTTKNFKKFLYFMFEIKINNLKIFTYHFSVYRVTGSVDNPSTTRPLVGAREVV